MRLSLALALMLATQSLAPTRVPVQVAQAGEDVTLTASNATEPLAWSIYKLVPVRTNANGGTLVFTRPAGMYLVQLSAANGTSTWQIQFTPGNLPNPGPVTPPTPQPIPAPPTPGPQPEVDPDSGFVYPVDPTGFSSQVFDALQKRSTHSAQDAASLSALYGLIARQIQIDGQRAKPGLRTLDQTSDFVKSSEAALLKGMTGGKLQAIKDAFPEVALAARDEFSRKVTSADGNLTPEARTSYVEFLQSLAAGFDRAALAKGSRR